MSKLTGHHKSALQSNSVYSDRPSQGCTSIQQCLLWPVTTRLHFNPALSTLTDHHKAALRSNSVHSDWPSQGCTSIQQCQLWLAIIRLNFNATVSTLTSHHKAALQCSSVHHKAKFDQKYKLVRRTNSLLTGSYKSETLRCWSSLRRAIYSIHLLDRCITHLVTH